ncbi:MAG: aminoacyl-tRNA deacylase [Castellaniella sp.]|uniref:aminoacyl-tRNA deacylase n=1 Tax=Castellaniella sp. TaxID=1955812 RepID=UPI001216BEA3|nr:aminoacyl-tRNA deacylase [Castellaniella sp.]TAN31152.1 MAG: aminoacyl-tRNA deacylase [Castellaniella sp.]
MSKTAKHTSETPATHWLRQQKIPFGEFPYDYVDHGGAKEAAHQLGVPLHQVAKTLIMEDERGQPLVVLMHGDREVSTKNLARQTGVKKVSPCTPENAQRNSGYQVGGTSPFGTRKRMPVWVESTLLDFDIVYLNGGRRGYLISVAADVLTGALGARPVQVALDHEH